MEVSFTINNKLYSITSKNISIDTTLNNFIRNHAKLTGTKSMCLEGGCGACVVMLSGIHPVTKQKTYWAVNSCLQNIYSCHGLDITTVEGIGSKKDGMHKIQKRLADFNGTQCGFCSPGMVMNMYSLMESKNGQVTMEEVENSLGGNICRCTGYRPILDAFKSLATDANKKLLDACSDIEDLSGNKICPKSGSVCSGKCSSSSNVDKNPISFVFTDEREWHKVYNLEQLFKVMGTIKYRPYILVAGNTAHGVYRRSNDLKVFVDISSVEELKTYKLNENSLELGGGVTLTEAMEIFTKVANENKNFEYLHEIARHFDKIGNPAVRNNGTLAGNLMIKNAHNEFPSDIFIIFEAIHATITVSSNTKNGTKISPKDFILTDMNKKVLTKITLPSYDPSKFIFRSFKIMPRAQNAHAYVNAAFLLQLSDEKVVSAKLCFGGIKPDFIHAANTETFLINENPFDNSTMQRALTILNEEIKPDWILPDASPEYRKNLALALFYKFILCIAPTDKVSPKYKSGAETLKRELSHGTQTFDTYQQNWPLTKNVPKIEAAVQCTGEAKYVNDFPAMSNELHAAFVTSKFVHGVIGIIDASKALDLPGVVAFYAARDIPGKNTFMPENYLFVCEPEEIFASSKICFHNQPIGMIVAKSFEIANKAVELVTISYVEDHKVPEVKTSIFQVKDDPIRTQVCPEYCKEGEKSDEKPSQTITGNFYFDSQYHFTLETQSCLCIPIEDGLDVYSATQWMDGTQIAIAEALKLPNNAVNMNVRRLGGAFGGKISRSSQIACACALAARLLNRPVRFVMTMEANISIAGLRYPCYNDYKIDIDENGKIINLHTEYIEDYGCSYNEPVYLTTGFLSNCYDSKSYNVIAKKARTDKASNTWCRGPGTLEGIAMIENIMEHISRSLGKDPVDIRIANLPHDSEMKTHLSDFVNTTDYHNRKKEIDVFNAMNRWIKRGIAIVPIRFHVEYFGSLHALVSIYHRDGTVSITVGGIEMGQGLNTKVAQVTAFTLGIPLEKVIVKPSNSLSSPNDIVTGGSIGSEISCFAAKKACEIINERLKPIKDENRNLSWEEMIEKAFAADVDLSANYMYKSADVNEYHLFGASCCEIEVDILTGNILIKRVDIMEDVGESISPGIDIGQIEGGFVMGLGYWLMENIIYDRETGELLTNRTWNYKVPGAKDIPIDFRVNFLRKASNPFGVLRSKAVGEPPLCMAIVALFALRHALDSARKDSGIKNDVDYYQLGAPTTCEKIFSIANNKPEMFLLT